MKTVKERVNNNPFIRSIKGKLKRKTHDKAWDSDDETDTSAKSGHDEQHNDTFQDDIDESSTTTISTRSKSSLSETSETRPLAHHDDQTLGSAPEIATTVKGQDRRSHQSQWKKSNERAYVVKNQKLDRILEFEQHNKEIDNEFLDEENGDVRFRADDDDDPTSDYESDYNTLRKRRLSGDRGSNGLGASRHFYSVPDLHSKELLQAERKRNKPEVLNIINVSHSREFIVSPNDGTANFRKTSQNTFPEKDAKVQALEDRKTKMLKMFDRTNPKVETELFKMGLTYIQRKSHFPLVILKGSRSGCGFVGKMLFRHIMSTQSNVDSYYMREAGELNMLHERRNAVVLVIEANGGTGGNENRLDGWFEVLKEWMPKGSKERGNLTLILTLNDRSKVKHPILSKYSDYILDADSCRPSYETKGKLVEALMKQNSIRVIPCTNEQFQPRTTEDGKLQFIDRNTVNDIVPFLASKECVGELSEFFTGHLSEGLHFFRRPIPKFVKVMRKLYREGSVSFLALLAVHALGGVPISSNGTSSRKQIWDDPFEKPWRSMTSIDKLSKAKALGKQYEGIDVQFFYRFAKENGHQHNLGNTIRKAAYGLVGKFLDKTGEVFKFANGRIYFSFLLVLYEAYPKSIENCDNDFFFNFIKLRNAVYDEEPDSSILIDDRKMDEMTRFVCCRFKREIMLKNVAKCMGHPVMSPKFFKLFLKYLNETVYLTWKVLKQTDTDPKEAYSCLYHGMTNPNFDFATSEKNITELIVGHGIWRRKRRSVKWKKWIALQERVALNRASEVSNTKTFRILVEAGAEISLESLTNAITKGSVEIIKIIMERQVTDKQGWIIKAAINAALKLTESNLTPDLIGLLRKLITNSSIEALATAGEGPLIHWMVKENKADVLRKLLGDEHLKTAVDINATFNGETPLLAAIRLEHQDIVQLLLQYNATLRHKEFALASSQGNVCILEMLHKRRPATFFEEDENGLTPLYFAVFCGKLEAVKFILSKSKNINTSKFESGLQTTKKIDGQTALHVAATKGHSEIIEILVNEGFDICATDRSGDTPMSLAYRNKHTQTLRCIINILKSKNLPTDENILMIAVRNGDTDVIDLINNSGFQVNYENSTFNLMLRESIEQSMHAMARCILSYWGNANKALDGVMPVHIAAMNGDSDMLKILIEFGADMTAKTESLGSSIIHIGVEQNNNEFLQSVFRMPDSNDLIDMKNFLGNTALHVASKLGRLSNLKILLELGFRTDIPNKDGHRPLEIVELEIQGAISRTKECQSKSLVDCKKLLEAHSCRQF